MPFTPAHMLAAVPLAYCWRGKAPVAALAIGTMAPDWPLFFAWGPSYLQTHAAVSGALYTLPLAFGLYMFWHWLCREAVCALLPAFLSARIPRSERRPGLAPVCYWLAVLLALWLGSLTHTIWDAFTHRGQWGVALFPILSQGWVEYAGVSLPGYKVLQYGSSIGGLVALLLYLVLWVRQAPVEELRPWHSLAWLRTAIGFALLAVPTIVAVTAASSALLEANNWQSIRTAVFLGIVNGGQTFIVGLIAYSTWYTVWMFLYRRDRL